MPDSASIRARNPGRGSPALWLQTFAAPDVGPEDTESSPSGSMYRTGLFKLNAARFDRRGVDCFDSRAQPRSGLSGALVDSRAQSRRGTGTATTSVESDPTVAQGKQIASAIQHPVLD